MQLNFREEFGDDCKLRNNFFVNLKIRDKVQEFCKKYLNSSFEFYVITKHPNYPHNTSHINSSQLPDPFISFGCPLSNRTVSSFTKKEICEKFLDKRIHIAKISEKSKRILKRFFFITEIIFCVFSKFLFNILFIRYAIEWKRKKIIANRRERICVR